MSEIDDIFSSKHESKEIDPATRAKKKKKAKSNKRKREPELLHDLEGPTKSRPIPETVIDPSITLPSTKRPRTEKSTDDVKLNASTISTKDAFDDNFADSRGFRQRLCLFLSTLSCSRFSITACGPITKTMSLSGKKTKEGWNIYKEEELGLLGTGGGEQVQYRGFLPFLLT